MKRFSLRTLFSIIGIFAAFLAGWIGNDSLQKLNSRYTVYYTDDDPTVRVTRVFAEQYATKSPAWNTKSAPPITALQARQIAEDYRDAKLNKKSTWRWNLQSLTLRPLEKRLEQWCWLVEYRVCPLSVDICGHWPDIETVILMDGSVIEPEFSSTLATYGVETTESQDNK